jgi:hypothetical protein
MKEWFLSLTVLEQVFFWTAIVGTILLILMCFSSFGGDVDLDGDGIIDIEADPDSGVCIFTSKSITAFLAVGGWSGLLTCALISDKLQWVSIIVAVLAGACAMAIVVILIRAMLKLQCNGVFQIEKLVGSSATVYVSIPPKRSGRGKITLNAQGKFVELDAMTDDDERIPVNEVVEITSTENECTVVKRAE